ncbi:hypothetical protein KKG83_06820 [Candidatus Micrarchaeota archaeon]|nr:hypothetical protein [Candidatus Micrarchaeota archaeon]MBU2477156.1 hypothetical protein [Candidatus Micrarchaeota archaeon]
MNLSLEFKGHLEEIIEKAIDKGIVKTRAEAVRLGLLELDKEYHLVEADYNPVDELPLKEEFVKELVKRSKEKPIKAKSIDDLFK